MIATLAVIALAVIVIWAIGAPIARFTGVCTVILGLLLLSAGKPLLETAHMITIGAVVWLAGHVLTACKTGHWHSRLAHTLVVRTPLRVLDPIHGRHHRTARAARKANRSRPQPVHRPMTTNEHFAEWERELDDTRPQHPSPGPGSSSWRYVPLWQRYSDAVARSYLGKVNRRIDRQP